MIPWKKIANKSSFIHSEQGWSIVDKNNNDAVSSNAPVVNTIPEENLKELAGKSISPKEIRRFAWEQRNTRFMSRDNAIIWTYYDEEADKSYIGVGATVKPALLDKVDKQKVLRGFE